MLSKNLSIVSVIVAVIALLIGGLSFIRAASLQTEVLSLAEEARSIFSKAASLQTKVENSLEEDILVSDEVKFVINRIGAKELEPARPVDVPNVIRDPHDVPEPIKRTEPTTVKLELTVEEVVSELADGTTYSFWTFNGTVPGPMLRVMEGDTIELTLNNPTSSAVFHNIDLHAVNGPGGGAPVTAVGPGESKTFTFKALQVGAFVHHCAFAIK